MKIKNLIAVAALLLGSTNAFAAPDTYVSKDGHIFGYNAAELAASESKTVEGVFEGIGNAERTTVTIPATVQISDPKTEAKYTIKVTSVKDNWWTGGSNGAVDVTAKVATLSIDVTNLTAGLEAADYNGLSKLATLTITDTSAAGKSKTTAFPGMNTAKSITSLDIAAVQAKALTADMFYNTGLKTIKLPATLETINGGAFQECADLEGTIVIPAGVKTIGNKAFKNAAKVDIDLSKAAALETIGNEAFLGTAITTANLNACVVLTSIGNGAFKDCAKLTKLQMSGIAKGKLETIGNDAFNGTAIAAANIPATVTSVGIAAFANCKSMTQVSAMAGLDKIQNYTFQNCEKLEKITISKKVETIGLCAFEGCKALATVTFAEREDADPKLSTIDYKAFKDCEALTSIDLSGTEITAINGNANAQFLGCTALKEIKVPATLTSIGAQAFGDCVLESLDLSETGITTLNAIFARGKKGDPATRVWPDAKNPYSSLKSITLPASFKNLLDYSGSKNGVFSYCTSLEEITLPIADAAAADDAIPAYAFYYCTSLKQVNYSPKEAITDDVFNDEAFLGCTPFVAIKTNTYYTSFHNAPINTTFGGAQSDKVTTVEDKGGSGKFYAKLCPLSDVAISVSDAKVYSIYVDGGTAYFQSLLQRGGYYNIYAGQHVIVKTDEAKDVKLRAWGGSYSVTVDEIFSFEEDVPTAKFQGEAKYGSSPYYYSNGDEVVYWPSTYIYRLTNNASTGGFGFTFFGGDTMKEGQFFILSTKKPVGAAPLNIVWLDENGFVEEDGATAIKSIDKADAEDGAIYNLQGVRVNAAKKGLYIKNGKKYIMK